MSSCKAEGPSVSISQGAGLGCGPGPGWGRAWAAIGVSLPRGRFSPSLSKNTQRLKHRREENPQSQSSTFSGEGNPTPEAHECYRAASAPLPPANSRGVGREVGAPARPTPTESRVRGGRDFWSAHSYALSHSHIFQMRLLKAGEVNRTQACNYTILESSSISKCLKLFLSKRK